LLEATILILFRFLLDATRFSSASNRQANPFSAPLVRRGKRGAVRWAEFTQEVINPCASVEEKTHPIKTQLDTGF
jgi:hypothetical protein